MFNSLIAQGLVKQKRYENGLSVFKYAKRVFYEGLWNTGPLLLEARGMVLDDEGNKVIWPFTKVFNYGENGAGSYLKSETRVVAPRKVNGFMAACRFWKGELIVSTTGSLDSDFAALARSHIEKLNQEALEEFADGFTLIFEICDSSDPHIVEEEEGVYLIGMRNMMELSAYCGKMVPEAVLNGSAELLGAKRPEVFRGTFGDLWDQVKTCEHEGWMVIDASTRETVMKIKSPHYLTKKFLMRMGTNKVEIMANQPQEFKKTIDEEYYPLVDFITASYRQSWKNMSDQERRAVIEDFLKNGEGRV